MTFVQFSFIVNFLLIKLTGNSLLCLNKKYVIILTYILINVPYGDQSRFPQECMEFQTLFLTVSGHHPIIYSPESLQSVFVISVITDLKFNEL